MNVLLLNIALDQKYPCAERRTIVESARTHRTRTGPPPPRLLSRPRILIVEDEPALLRALRINLRARSYDVPTATAGRAGAGRGRAASAGRSPPRPRPARPGRHRGDPRAARLVPGPGDRAVRADRVGDKIGALDAGADDYVTKPFDMEELLARLRARSAATTAPPGSPVIIGPCAIDLAARTVSRDGQPVRLTPTEWRLLEVLLPTRPARRWPSAAHRGVGARFRAEGHYLRFHMAGLRRKLEDDPHRPRTC